MNARSDAVVSSQKGVLDEDASAVEPPAQAPVPPWAERLAHVIPLLVLPSGLWRLGVAFGFPMGMLNDAGELVGQRGWTAVYIAAISILS
jgi:hypothetical protein